MKWRIGLGLAALMACLITFTAATARDASPSSARRGLARSTPQAYAGYTLFAPLADTKTYLIDNAGKLVHTWTSQYEPGQSVYLLDDGTLLRTAREPRNRSFEGGGIGGRIERLAPDSTVLWSFVYADADHCQHHDVEPLPNGHVLLIAWEKKTSADYKAAGGDPALLPGDEIWPDTVIEVAPHGASGGEIVWAWHMWDHLIQEYDESKANYNALEDHPELIHINFQRRAPRETPAELERLRSLGYVGGGDDDADDNAGGRGRGNGANGRDRRARHRGGPGGGADWAHTNAVAYNAELDQIALSIHNFNEIWIIDHSTTTAEAAGHTGGRSGHGGDLLYRWGNPRAYSRGAAGDQQLFAQHDARWIPTGTPGAGHLLVFNNGTHRPGGAQYSSIVEIAPPVDARGNYRLEAGKPFEPAEPAWEYKATQPEEFFSSHISGAERLANGNTLICSGEQSRIFEVTAAGKIVWDYTNAFASARRRPDRGPGNRRFGDRGPAHRGTADRGSADRGSADRDSGGPPRGRRADRGPGKRPPHPPGGPGGLFRASRIAADAPGIRRLLATASASAHDDE
ncbi:MAG TPA: aryl-sulfate sulfotransferase [Phycisphaerae bacterium]|nr:aryl-sulfate sulfotransferase [Phycisphaerales bacterium]HRX84814.1 aryl-sulfate sulfotransferase [Phycisphaerae bacterium]